ncbi:wax ester/triacylglycerol synthase domain-containing protein [Nocardia sp. NPDC003693]
MKSLAPRDATMYWLSARTRNDLFLLYAFVDTGQSVKRLREILANRVARVPDLLARVLDTPANIAYPIWEPCGFTDDQVAEHSPGGVSWDAIPAALGELLGTGLRADRRPWRLHLFRGVTGAPGAEPGESALIAVLQLSHALADGRRAAELARALFAAAEFGDAAAGSRTAEGRDGFGSGAAPAGLPGRLIARAHDAAADLLSTVLPRPWAAAALALPVIPIDMARTVFRGIAAYRAERELAELTASGAIPPPASPVGPTVFNGDGIPPAAHAVRMLVRDADRLRVPGRTVTVVVATAVSLALERYSAESGEPAAPLFAQVPMAVSGDGRTRNSYHDLSVDLLAGEPDPAERAAGIAAGLAERRTRAAHPLQAARTRATAAIPAPILYRDIASYPIDVLPQSVSGHTVISSVHRGPADLAFAGGRVLFTAGFPGLGSVMHLTHGVHGLGDTVTVSVHADPAVVIRLDDYAALLDSALDEVVAALRAAGDPAPTDAFR